MLAELAAFNTVLPREPTDGWRYHTENDFYATADGTVLHAMLRHLAPPRVIEVGSGYSSALMLDTAERHQLGTRFTFIDPEPERVRGLLRSDDLATVIARTVKEIPLETFTELEAGDVPSSIRRTSAGPGAT